MAHLDALLEKVRKIEETSDSLIAWSRGLAAELREFKDQPAEIEAIAARLDAQAEENAAAQLENTPAEPE